MPHNAFWQRNEQGEGTETLSGLVRNRWLEVALNGGWGRGLQPRIPVSVDELISEGIACARAGAAIVHFHAYDREGRTSDDAGIYAAVIGGIRSDVDAIVYPTIAFDGTDRFSFVETLARKGLLEWAALDTGSVNLEPLRRYRDRHPRLGLSQ